MAAAPIQPVDNLDEAAGQVRPLELSFAGHPRLPGRVIAADFVEIHGQRVFLDGAVVAEQGVWTAPSRSIAARLGRSPGGGGHRACHPCQ